MTGNSRPSKGSASLADSYLGVLANLAGVLLGVFGLYFYIGWRAQEKAPEAPLSVVTEEAPAPVETKVVAIPPPPPKEVAKAKPRPAPATPVVDTTAIDRAKETLNQSKRDRALADARADEAARKLAKASAEASSAAAAGKSLALRVHDPSPQISRAKARGGFLRAERDKLKGELIAIATAPRPKAKSLIDKNPVAKPAGDEEYHFELRRNRVSFIDLDRLITKVKADAQLRLRIADNARVIDSTVGPVGAFSLRYVLGRALPQGIEEALERHGLSYDLRGWEVIPEFEGRGETYDAARRPVSEYMRIVNRLNPHSATITMWVYPDGFNIYRQLRDDLHARGFMVAARPLPEGMSIRGSPSGSLSAGQ